MFSIFIKSVKGYVDKPLDPDQILVIMKSSGSAVFAEIKKNFINQRKGAQWLSGRVHDSRPRGRGFEPHRHYCLVSLSKNGNPSLVLVQPRNTCPFMTERLLMGHKESNQTKTNQRISNYFGYFNLWFLEICIEPTKIIWKEDSMGQNG